MTVGKLKEILKFSKDEDVVLVREEGGFSEIENWMSAIFPSNDDSIDFISALIIYRGKKNEGAVSKILEPARM